MNERSNEKINMGVSFKLVCHLSENVQFLLKPFYPFFGIEVTVFAYLSSFVFSF